MLRKISCRKLLRENLFFNNGLNAVLGPNSGANSIGKSSVLMLIDFVFGGDDFIKLSKDVIAEVGHLKVDFVFLLNNIEYSFRRNTENPSKVIFRGVVDEEKTIDDFRCFLSQHYSLLQNGPSFRNLVSRFSRIWGKENYNPNKPLNSYPGEGYASIKDFLIKSFGFYDLITELEELRALNVGRKKNLESAFKEGFIKKINLKEYKKNKNDLKDIDKAIETIKDNLELYAANINSILSEKGLNLAHEKTLFLKEKRSIESRLFRVNDNINNTRPIKQQYFNKVVDFFPEINQERLSKVESFHVTISEILSNKLKKEKELLLFQLQELDEHIKNIDFEIKRLASAIDKPSEIVDEVLSLSVRKKEVESTIEYRDMQDSLASEIKILKDELKIKTQEILSKIENKINDILKSYNVIFYDANRVPPKIIFQDASYILDHHADSGTGKSYANMLALDMTFLNTTQLPILIEDSMLFKNIEVLAVDKIIKSFDSSRKQIFISMDQLGIYKEETRHILRKSKFMRISKKYPAFKKTWNIEKA